MLDLISIVANVATSQGISKTRIIYSKKSGLIISVDSQNIIANNSDTVVYNDDCLLFAGMGDIHIHAREDLSQKNINKESFQSACCAAINGGVTHVADMPNNPIPPIDDESYLAKAKLAQDQKIPFLMYAGIGPNTYPLTFKVPYKAFMGPSIGDLYFKSNLDLEIAIERYKHQWVSFHCEDPIELETHKSEKDHFLRRPIKAEILATEFALILIEKFHLIGKLCHYSSGDGLQKILAAKKRGVKVYTEVTPQHLFFSEDIIKSDYQNNEVMFQMNPPIRAEADRLKMLAAVKSGDIDYLATDHAPHTNQEKEKGMSGMPGLDTYGLFVTWLLNEQKVDPKIIAKMTAENPGKFFNEFNQDSKWGNGLGFVLPGFAANFTVLNLVKPTTFTLEQMQSKARWSPFINFTFSGSVESVIVLGEAVSF